MNRTALLASICGLVVVTVLAALATACGSTRTIAAAPVTISVLNYNILHGLYDEDPDAPDFDRLEERLTLLAGELERIKPDIVVLQEVVLKGPQGYPDVKSMLLAALGGEYQVVFAEAATGSINEGAVGRMTLTRLPLVSSAGRVIFMGRSAHRTTVRTQGGVIDIYNVHMEGPELVGHQELEVTRLIDFIDRSRRNQNPVILAGDFNSQPDDTALVKVRAAGFVDTLAAKQNVACAKIGDPGCTRAQFPSLSSPRNLASIRIDYMFARGGADLELRILESRPFLNEPLKDEQGRPLWASDHIGILTRFELVSKKAPPASADATGNR